MSDAPATPPETPGSGWVPQATLEERIRAKNQEIAALQQQLQAGQQQLQALPALQQQAQAAAALQERFSRYQTLAQTGFANPAYLEGFESAYAGYRSSAGQQALSFADWFQGPARQHPFLAPHFSAASPAASAPPSAPPGSPPPIAPSAPPPAVAPPSSLPAPPPAVAPPAPQGRMTPEQLQRHLASMTLEQQIEWARANRQNYPGADLFIKPKKQAAAAT